jgi:hypothetical protein
LRASVEDGLELFKSETSPHLGISWTADDLLRQQMTIGEQLCFNIITSLDACLRLRDKICFFLFTLNLPFPSSTIRFCSHSAGLLF